MADQPPRKENDDIRDAGSNRDLESESPVGDTLDEDTDDDRNSRSAADQDESSLRRGQNRNDRDVSGDAPRDSDFRDNSLL